MLAGVTDRMPDVPSVELPYSAQYGPAGSAGLLGEAYAATVRLGVALALAELDRGPAILLGYSAGAQVAHTVAARGHPNLVGAAFMADPTMPPHIGPGSGITGGDPKPIRVPHQWFWNPADVICQAPADSPLRTISDVTADFSAQAFPSWTWSLVDELRANRWQVAGKHLFDDPVAQWRRWSSAIVGAVGYLDGSEHVVAYRGARQEAMVSWVSQLV